MLHTIFKASEPSSYGEEDCLVVNQVFKKMNDGGRAGVNNSFPEQDSASV